MVGFRKMSNRKQRGERHKVDILKTLLKWEDWYGLYSGITCLATRFSHPPATLKAL